jgi:hypothetical protein
LLLTPNENSNSFNNIDFSNIGNSISKDSNAFKKIQKFSKLTTNSLNRDSVADTQVFNRINNVYSTTSNLNNSDYYYGNPRQHNHACLDSFLPSFTTLVNTKGFTKFVDYSLNVNSNTSLGAKFFKTNTQQTSFYNENLEYSTRVFGDNILKINSLLHNYFGKPDLFFSK